MSSNCSERNILLTISYDGTDFCGWQRQDEKGSEAQRTVQGEVEKALEKLHKQKITLYGSGRTDSGVHALGQAANFTSPIPSIPAEHYVRALNAFLPDEALKFAKILYFYGCHPAAYDDNKLMWSSKND